MVLLQGVTMKFLRTTNEKGFTLVELMIVVAIIGVLSAVAIPNFRKYQAKAKSSEAKLQLSAAYTAEQAFFGDYGIYHNCLASMGYNPSAEAATRYYSVGFTNGVVAINNNAYGDATNSGLNTGACPIAVAAVGIGTPVNTVNFFGTKGTGGLNAGSYAYLSVGGGSTLGTQGPGEQRFVMSAVGIIDSAFTTAAAANNTAGAPSRFTVNEIKTIREVSPGY